jgi:geranylgeranyl pyrophosphate synthase
MAILAGDALMGLAFELLTDSVHPAKKSSQLLRELALGTNGMIAGQVYDTLPDFDESVDAPTRLRTIHRHKTGALITTPAAARRAGHHPARRARHHAACRAGHNATRRGLGHTTCSTASPTSSTRQLCVRASHDHAAKSNPGDI